MATAFNYKSVKAILEKGLDAVAFGEPANNSPVVHENFRGAAYYSNQELMRMLTQQTIDSLRALRLPAMAQAYAEQMAGPKAADLSFDQRLGMIVDREIATRANKRLARLIRETRLRLNAVITGPTGVGRSFIARALGNLACRLTLNTGS